MSEVLALSPVGRIHPSLNLGIPNMSLLQHQLDSTSQVLGVHPIELRLTQKHETSSRPPYCWPSNMSLDPSARKFIGWT
jgi:hypothetical protein